MLQGGTCGLAAGHAGVVLHVLGSVRQQQRLPAAQQVLTPALRLPRYPEAEGAASLCTQQPRA